VVRPRLPAAGKDGTVLGVDEFHDVPAQDLRLVRIAVKGEPGRVDVDHSPAARDAHGLQGILEEGPVFPLRLHEGVFRPLAVRDVPQDRQHRRRVPAGIPQGHVGHAVEGHVLAVPVRQHRVAAVDAAVPERPDRVTGVGFAGPLPPAEHFVAFAAHAVRGKPALRLVVAPDDVELPVDHYHAVAYGAEDRVELALAGAQGLLGTHALLHLAGQLQVRAVELRRSLLHPPLEFLARPPELLFRLPERGDGALELRVDVFELHRGLFPRPLEEVGEGGNDEKGRKEAQLEVQGIRREGAGRILPHEEDNGRHEHDQRSGQPRPGAQDKRRDQGIGKVPDVGRVVHPAGEEQVVVQDPDDHHGAVEGRHEVLRPAQEENQERQEQGGAVVQTGEPRVVLKVGERSEQDEIENADQREGVEHEDLPRDITAQILPDPAADQIEGDPFQFLHVQGHGLGQAPGRKHRAGASELPWDKQVPCHFGPRRGKRADTYVRDFYRLFLGVGSLTGRASASRKWRPAGFLTPG